MPTNNDLDRLSRITQATIEGYQKQLNQKAELQANADNQQAARDAALAQLIRGKQMDQENSDHQLHTKNALDLASEARRAKALDEMYHKYPGRAVGVTGADGATIGAPPEAKAAGKSAQQKRLEATSLNNIYTNQTKDIKDQQIALDAAAKLTSDPSNIDDQQLRRQLAMAVNKGALSDSDVNDALPSDLEQMARKGYNFVQPALSMFGAKKVPIYSEGTVKGIDKLLKGKQDIVKHRLDEAGNQIQMMAPTVAPTISAEEPETLAQLLKGITSPRMEQQKRIEQPQGFNPDAYLQGK